MGACAALDCRWFHLHSGNARRIGEGLQAMIWGVTGTRKGATPYQVASVAWLFSRYGITEHHNGDCIGVDSQIYYLARSFGAHVEIHPPTSDKYRAFNGDCKDNWWRPQTYHERDRETVHESDALVACPRLVVEEGPEHSGTWWTVNYARSVKKPIAIVWPNGHITYENWTLSRV